MNARLDRTKPPPAAKSRGVLMDRRLPQPRGRALVVEQPPDQPQAFRDFDDFRRIARVLVGRADALEHLDRGALKASSSVFADVRPMLEDFSDGLAVFDRDEFYRETKARRYDLDGPATSRQITRRYVSEQVAMLISGFINAKSATELFTFRLVLAIEAANPSAIVLEATCRELILAKPIVPAVSEVIEELGRQGEWWFFALDSIRFLAETFAQTNAPQTNAPRLQGPRV
jgi:hypothetical protein